MKLAFLKKLFAIFALVIVISQNSLADSQTKGVNIFKTWKDDISYTTENVSKYPYELVLFGALFGGSILADRGIKSYVEKHQNSTAHKIADVLNVPGRGYYTFPAAALFGVIGYYSKDNKLTSASITSIESGITAGIICVGLKGIVGRERPYATSNPFVFHPFKFSGNKYHSFPSGDVTISWAMITPYAVYYNEPLLYILPIGVNFARIYTKTNIG